jgi:hypothetical protein
MLNPFLLFIYHWWRGNFSPRAHEGIRVQLMQFAGAFAKKLRDWCAQSAGARESENPRAKLPIPAFLFIAVMQTAPLHPQRVAAGVYRVARVAYGTRDSIITCTAHTFSHAAP